MVSEFYRLDGQPIGANNVSIRGIDHVDQTFTIKIRSMSSVDAGRLKFLIEKYFYEVVHCEKTGERFFCNVCDHESAEAQKAA